MQTRCKAGELAIVTSVPSPLHGLIGRVVRVIVPFENQGRATWQIEDAEVFVSRGRFIADGRIWNIGESYSIGAMFDSWLTPVRGGLNADDEVREYVEIVEAVKRKGASA